MTSPARGTVKLPRLRTKDELLKTSPELFNKLLLGEDMSSARSTTPQTSKTLRNTHSAGHSTLGRTTSATKAGQLAAYDTPRGFGDEPLTVDQELSIELESVKRERQQLLESISQVKAESGTAGGEAQQADIRQLLKELELKKAKLNELKGESRRTEAAIAKIRDDDTDAQRLTPDDCVEENAYIQELRDEMTRVEEDLLEADAKNRLYYLLGERTRREHMAIDQRVREKQDCKHACLEDLANLTEHFNATRAAKELAEKELAKTKRQVEEARSDWTRKIRERRAEVRELKKRQQKEREKEVKRREKQLEKEKTERAAQAKLKMEQEAYQLQVAALAPKIEAMEASWNRLRAISGAETPNEVIEYWQGLKAKQQRMHELVVLAERREAACKSEVSQLLASRSAMFESSKAAAAVAAAAAAAAQEAVDKAQAEGAHGVVDAETANAKIEAAEKRMDAAQVQFNKLRSICVAAEQGLRSLLQRLMIALEEVNPACAVPSAAQTIRTPSGAQASLTVASQSGGSRLQSAGASSTTSSHVADGMRRSAGGGTGSPMGKQGRITRDAVSPAVDSALASKANRINSTRTRDARSAASGLSDGPGAAGPGSNLAIVAEDTSAVSLSLDKAVPVTGLPLTGYGLSSGAHSGRPTLPSRGQNTIEDDSFFDSLGQLLSQVAERLETLLEADEALDLQAIQAAAAALEKSSISGGNTAQQTPRIPLAAAQPAAEGLQQALSAAAAAADAVVDTAAESSAVSGISAAAAAAEAEGGAHAGDDNAAEPDDTEEGTMTAAADEGSQADVTTAQMETASDGEQGQDASQGEDAAVEAAEADAAADAAEDAGGGEDAAEGGMVAEAKDEAADGAEDAGAPDDSAEQDCVAITDTELPAGDDAELSATASGAAEGEQDANEVQQTDSGNMTQPVNDPPHSAEADKQHAAAGAESFEQQRKRTSSVTSSLHGAAAAGHAGSPRSLHGAVSGAGDASEATVSFVSTVPAAALAVGGIVSNIPESEKALMKGLYRRTWTGAPWLDTVSDNPLELSFVPSMKRKKGKKKEAAAAPDLTRILGYTPPNEVPIESESDADSGGDEDANAADGVIDRDWIKMRAAKMTARHNAKQAAAAAAAQQKGVQ